MLIKGLYPFCVVVFWSIRTTRMYFFPLKNGCVKVLFVFLFVSMQLTVSDLPLQRKEKGINTSSSFVMQNGVAAAASHEAIHVEDVEFSIDALPPPPSPIPGLTDTDLQVQRRSPEVSGATLEPPPPPKTGGTLERMVHSPLPPLLDNYDLEYGPVSSTEPELAPLTDDGELPRFDEINEQYDFLRRTLSHSRTRYSARFKRPHKQQQQQQQQQQSSASGIDRQSSLDRPGLRRDREQQSSLDSPGMSRKHKERGREGRRVENGGMVSQLGRRQTDIGEHPLRQRQRKAPGQDKRSAPNNTAGERPDHYCSLKMP